MAFPATAQVTERIVWMGEEVLNLIEAEGAEVFDNEPGRIQALFHRFAGAAELYQYLYANGPDARAMASFVARVERAFLQACFSARRQQATLAETAAE